MSDHISESTQAEASASGERDPHGRPRPQYGEYAPDTAGSSRSDRDRADHGNTPHGDNRYRESTRTPHGVPHNLGVTGSAATRPVRPTETAGLRSRKEERAAAAASTSTPEERQLAPRRHPDSDEDAGAVLPARRDRVPTIILLVFGAVSALSLAGSLQTLPATLHRLQSALEVTDPLPTWVAPMGTIAALTVLFLWAIALLWSIQRMRRKKLTFWVPLACGVVAALLTFAVTSAGMMGALPLELLTDPERAREVLDAVQTLQ